MRTPTPAIAVTIALFGGAALALGDALPVVSGGSRGFAGTALLVALAVVPVAVAALLLRQQPAASLGVLAGLAALMPGRIVLDLRFAVDASVVSRPALYMPDTLTGPAPASGLWLMLGGQAGLLVAGAFAVKRLAAVARPAGHSLGDSSPGAPGRGLVPGAACAGVLAGIGSLMAPFASGDAYLVPQGALERGALGLTGSVLFAVALPLAAVSAASTGRPLFARGCFVGLGLGALAMSLPNLVAAFVMSELSLRPGAVIVLIGALGMLALVAVPRDHSEVTEAAGSAVGDVAGLDPTGAATTRNSPTRNSPTRNSPTGGSPTGGSATGGSAAGDDTAQGSVSGPLTHAGYARMPSLRRFELAVAVAALATCAAALIGSVTSQVTSSIGGSDGTGTRWPLLVAGLVTGLLGATLLVPRMAAWLRPALSVVWVSVPVAGMSILGTGVAAGETGGVLAPGPGALWTVLAMVLAVVTACLSAVAGILDREDVPHGISDGSGGPDVSRGSDVAGWGSTGSGSVLRTVATVGAVLAVVGFVLPISGSAEYAVPGLVSNLTTGSWGLLAGLLGVLAAVGIAMYSRPVRAAPVLGGAACVSALRTAEWPLTTLRMSDSAPTVGWWFALLGTLVLAVAAGTVVAGRLPSRSTVHTG